MNKCGYELPGAIASELADKDEPVEYLKQRFASRLNEHYEGKGFAVAKERIFFTDWEVGDRPDLRALGICGVASMREEIRGYLVDNGIFENGEQELEELFRMREGSIKGE